MVLSAHGRILRQLLPPGRLFSEAPDSTLQALLDGLGAELDRVSGDAADLPRQVDPATGAESLSDWERVLGLPDDCGAPPVTLEDRRRAVLGRLQAGDNLSRSFYVDLARSQGYEVTIEELEAAPFRVGLGRCGDTLGTEAGVFRWTMVVKTSRQHFFRAGRSRCGDGLVSLSDRLLECVIERAAPAHTQLGFRYEFTDGGSGGPECWLDVGQGVDGALRIYTQDGELVVYDATGRELRLELVDGELEILDGLGGALTLGLVCSELIGCALSVLTASGDALQWNANGETLVVVTSAGSLTLELEGDQLTVVDEFGEPLSLPLICGAAPEQWWRVFDPQTGRTLSVRTVNGRLLAEIAPGNRVEIATTAAPFTVLDEDGNPLTLPLFGTPV